MTEFDDIAAQEDAEWREDDRVETLGLLWFAVLFAMVIVAAVNSPPA
jgi:hypothetical protein